MSESEELEAQAVALAKQYGFLLPKVHKAFLLRLAVFLKWEKLKGAL